MEGGIKIEVIPCDIPLLSKKYYLSKCMPSAVYQVDVAHFLLSNTSFSQRFRRMSFLIFSPCATCLLACLCHVLRFEQTLAYQIEN